MAASGQQPNDCIHAIGVCGNGVINENSNGPGINDFLDGDNGAGCLLGGEHQSVWLLVKAASSGTLGFTITPVSGFGEDYDFAVFGPNVSCTDMGSPIRCSWANAFCAYCPSTGMNSNSTDLSEGSVGDGFVRWLNVNSGETYYILVDNYNSSSSGFTLNWTGSALLDCSVTEVCPEVDLGDNITACADDLPITLDAGHEDGATYTWQDGSSSSVFQAGFPGIYWVDVTKGLCTVRDSVVINVVPLPAVDLGPDAALCTGESIVLDATLTPEPAYLWQDGSTSGVYEVTGPGTYSVTVSQQGCSLTDEITIEYMEKPEFDLSLDDNAQQVPLLLCEGDRVTLSAYSPFADAYAWQDGSTLPEFTAEHTAWYRATAYNQGCSFTDSIRLTFAPAPEIDLVNEAAICSGSSLLLDASSENATGYIWQDGSTEPVFEVTETGTYEVMVLANNCYATEVVEVAVMDSPVFSLGEDMLLEQGEEFTVFAPNFEGAQYLWHDGSVADYFYAGPEFSGEISLTIQTDCGQAGARMIINREEEEEVVTDRADCDLVFPTGFSPNGDNHNDTFYPFILCDNVVDYELEIYNRWGERLFVSADPGRAWAPAAGRHEMDTYIWHAAYSFEENGELSRRSKSGMVLLLK
jgi:hypothetical protein